MADHQEDNDPFEEDIVFDEAGLLGGKMPRARRQATAGFLPTFMLFIRTVFLCVTFLGLGLCVSVSGGPLIKLEMGAGVPDSTAFHVFTARSVGMLFGGTLGSILFEVYNRQFLLSVSLVWVAASVTVLPFTVPTSFFWTLASTAALGTGLAFLFTGGNVLCLDLWGRKQGGAALQALHFSFSLGALVVPLVVQPFFANIQTSNTTLATNFTTSALPPTTTEDAIALRVIRAVGPEWSGSPRNLTTREILSDVELKRLTMPIGKINASASSTSLSSTSLVFNTTSTPSTSLLSSASSSPSATTSTTTTLKPLKKKPEYTDASNLDPDEKVTKWTKPPAGLPPPLPPPPPPVTTADTTLPITTTTSTTSSAATTAVGVLQDIIGNGTAATAFTSTTNNTNSSANTNVNSSIATTTSADAHPSTSESGVPTTVIIAPAPSSSSSSLPSPTSTSPNAATTTRASVTTPTTTTTTTTTPPTTTASSTTTPSTTTPATTTITTTAAAAATTTSTTTTSTTTTAAAAAAAAAAATATATTTPLHTTTTKPPLPDTQPTTTTTTKPPLPITQPTTTTTTSSTTPTTTFKGTTPNAMRPSPVLVTSEGGGVSDVDMESRGAGGGSEVFQLTAEVDDYELQDLRERPAGGSGGGGSGSLKPGTFSNASDDKPRFLEHVAQRLGDYGVTRVHLAYISIGILVEVDALVSVVVLCHHPREARSRQEGGPMASARPARAVLFTVLFSAFMFAAEAMQGALHHLLAGAGSPSGLPLTWGGEDGEGEGPDGQVVFWGLVCLVRFLCVPAAGCLGPRPGRLLAAAVFFAVAGAAFLVVGAAGRQDFAWAGVVFLAVGVAPVLPTSLLWMAQYMRVTHRLCALMVVVASFGNTLTHSLLAGAAGHPPTYAYVVLGLSLASACLLGVSVCAVHAGHHADNLGAPVGYQLASQHEEDSLELTPSASVVFTPADASTHEGGEAGQALLID